MHAVIENEKQWYRTHQWYKSCIETSCMQCSVLDNEIDASRLPMEMMSKTSTCAVCRALTVGWWRASLSDMTSLIDHSRSIFGPPPQPPHPPRSILDAYRELQLQVCFVVHACYENLYSPCMQKLVQLDTPTDTQLYSLLSSRILTHILALLRHILHCRRDRLLYGICRSSHNRTWYYCRHARADWSGSIANLLYTHAQSAKGLWEYSNFGEIIFISHFNASNYVYIAQIYANFVYKNERHLLHI